MLIVVHCFSRMDQQPQKIIYDACSDSKPILRNLLDMWISCVAIHLFKIVYVQA